MFNKDDNIKEQICIVINNENVIEYSNVNIKRSLEYMKKLKVLENLPSDSSVQYLKNGLKVVINKVFVSKCFYYVINIEFQIIACKNCKIAFKDKSTGLYNRNYLEYIMDKLEYFNNISSAVLVFIDIDKLKNINDMHGHLMGDIAIEFIGQAIRKNIRKEDIGIRYGGDEFIIILFNQKNDAANRVLRRIKSEIQMRTDFREVDLNISAGISYTERINDLESMIQIADDELYKEKKVKEENAKMKGKSHEFLKSQIETMRDELNRMLLNYGNEINKQEVLKLSQELDKLIVNYSNYK